MNRKPFIKGIIFDFDGLIIDTESAVFQAWRELYQIWNQELELGDWMSLVGKSNKEADPMDPLAELVGSQFDREQARERVAAREMELIAGQQILPGVKELINWSHNRNLKLAVASSSSREWVSGHLSDRGLLDHFDALSCSDDVERAKPDPALYTLSLEKLGIDAEEGLVFEDSPNGVLAAKKAGLYCVAVPNLITREIPFHDREGEPDLVVDSLEGFPIQVYLKEQ